MNVHTNEGGHFRKNLLLSMADTDSRPGSGASKGKRPSTTEKKSKKSVAVDDGAAAAASSLPIPSSKQQPAPTNLYEALERLDEKEKDVTRLEQELASADDKHKELYRINAKRLIQIAALESQLAKEQEKNKELTVELEKQHSMMDLVISFRDKESAREFNELTHANVELAAKLDVWKERARRLQQERFGFVQKFRAAKNQAFKGDGTGGFDTIAANDSDEEDDPEEGAARDSDDD